jgi:peptidoglycan/LPS O-acetylase OafA/YrhL
LERVVTHNAAIANQNGTGASARGGLLDLLRFAASLLIVIYHYSSEGPRPLESMSPIFLRGYLATDFFLILSGYVLGRSYGPKIIRGGVSLGDFLLKRISRVWPGHLVILAGFVAVVLLSALAGAAPRHPERFVWSALWMQVFLVQSWGFGGGGGWNLPTWSLSALLVCYAIFPALWRGLGRLRHGALPLALGLVGVLGADGLTTLITHRGLYDLPFAFGALRALPMFALGAGLARAVELGWPGERLAKWLGLGAAAVFVGLQIAGRFDTLSIICIALIVLAAGRLPVVKPSKLIVLGARLSFPLFLSHVFSGMIWFTVMRAIDAHIHLPEPAQWVLYAGSLPFALVAAWVFDRVIDQPLQTHVAPIIRRLRIPIPRIA